MTMNVSRQICTAFPSHMALASCSNCASIAPLLTIDHIDWQLFQSISGSLQSLISNHDRFTQNSEELRSFLANSSVLSIPAAPFILKNQVPMLWDNIPYPSSCLGHENAKSWESGDSASYASHETALSASQTREVQLVREGCRERLYWDRFRIAYRKLRSRMNFGHQSQETVFIAPFIYDPISRVSTSSVKPRYMMNHHTHHFGGSKAMVVDDYWVK
jgi:hypothetical protein